MKKIRKFLCVLLILFMFFGNLEKFFSYESTNQNTSTIENESTELNEDIIEEKATKVNDDEQEKTELELSTSNSEENSTINSEHIDETKSIEIFSNDGKSVITEGAFKYYLNANNEVIYRENINLQTKKVNYAEEYYPGTIYQVNNLNNGKKSIHISVDANGYVKYRAMIDKTSQNWIEIEEYLSKMKWSYGTAYGHSLEARFYINADKTIKFAYIFSAGNYTTPYARYEYLAGTKYGESHGSKISKYITSNWSISEGNFKYTMNYSGEVLYREYIDITTKKITYAEEYYPGTVYKINNLNNGKKSIYISVDGNGYVKYRAMIDKTSQNWIQIEEYLSKMKWAYGTAYGHNLEARFYINADKTIKFALIFAAGNYVSPYARYEYLSGTKYGEGHGSKISKITSGNWSKIEGNYKYYFNGGGEVIYREYIDPQTKKVTIAEEYFPGTIYQVSNLNNGKKSIYISIDANNYVKYRAMLDKSSQKWKEVEEYYGNTRWSYGTAYGHNIEARFYLNTDKTIKFAYVYDKGNFSVPHYKFEYQSGTKYGEGHGNKITKITDLMPSTKAVWPVPRGGVTCGVGCYSGHLGVDIQVRKAPGDAINSIIGGKVIETNNNCATTGSYGCGGGFGNYVIIHGVYNGVNYVIMYGHMQRDSLQVQVGSQVQSGQKIGAIGDSGSSEGYHVHIEVLKGRTTWTSYKGPGGREGIDFRREFGV